MRKLFSLSRMAVLALAAWPLLASASVADSWPVPQADAQGLRGATMPYTRYDCNYEGDATLGGGASLERDKTWNRFIITGQASDQTYVKMPVGASVTWTMKTYADGVTVRYTIKDKHPGGHGQKGGYALNEGELEFYVNDEAAGRVVLNSYYMYHYFSQGEGDPSHNPSSTASPAFAFDERHTRLSRMLKPGDRLTVKCLSGEEVGVDFVETEVVPEALTEDDVADGRQVFNVTAYGARPDAPGFDNRSAFNAAIRAANARGGVVFIPEGTWYMGMSAESNAQNQQGIWGFSAKNVKITGAGMWHTNIQFTGWLCFGGGVSAGNPTIGGTSDADNIEFCHMYLNSNLCWRNEPQAVYKAFMDIWCGGSVIHDIWEEHFECGIWLGDYNSNPIRYSDNARIVNCRLRNNLADGVNLCQGTSHAAVFNCNVRNNGDDGLAMWCNNHNGAKNETGNIFAYNTIEHIWRAGAIAVYGGTDQHVYNNYIAESFISSGYHSNNTFPGHGWGATPDKPVVVENNWFVRAGSFWDIFNRDYGAIDLEQELSNIVFRNNHMWECPAEAISIHQTQSNITIDGLYVNGAGVSGQTTNYSASDHSVGAGNFANTRGFTFKDFQIVRGSVPTAKVGASLDQYKTWPFWNMAPDNWSWVNEADVEWADEPRYPDSEGIVPAPNPLETLTDYNLVLTGIDWLTQKGIHNMYDGDRVTLRVRIDNKGVNSIPAEGAKFSVVMSVDGSTSFSATVTDGIAAGASKIIEFATPWTAEKGSHTFTATIDPARKLIHETSLTDNVRKKDVNVEEIPDGEEPAIEIVTHAGPDMGVVKVYFENLTGDADEVRVGDKLMPHAIVANYGSSTIRLGSGQGFLWAFNGSPEYNTGMLWDDSAHEIAPGQWIDITPNGGGNLSAGTLKWNSDYTFTATAGTVALWGRMDNPEKYNDNNADNNVLSADFTFPRLRPQYNPDPDRADNLVTGGLIDYEESQGGGDDPVSGFDPVVSAIYWNPGSPEIQAGETIDGFAVRVTNDSDTDLPAGKNVRLTLSIDGATVGTATHSTGIAAHSYTELTVNGSYTAAAGAHTVKAAVTQTAGELSADNNTRERTFNATGDLTAEPGRVYYSTESTAPVAGVHMVITEVRWANAANPEAPIRPGDKVRFSATVLNNGTETSPDRKHGIQFQFPAGNTSDIVWDDRVTNGCDPGSSFVLTAYNGNQRSDGLWTAVKGTTQITAWFNDTHDLGAWESKFDFPVEITDAPTELKYHESPTGADERGSADASDDATVADEMAEHAPEADVWYNLQGMRIEAPATAGLYIRNGRKVYYRP